MKGGNTSLSISFPWARYLSPWPTSILSSLGSRSRPRTYGQSYLRGATNYMARRFSSSWVDSLRVPPVTRIPWEDLLRNMSPNLVNWKRPPLVPALLDETQPIDFQLLDVHEQGEEGIVLFGVTKMGHSICVNITSFQSLPCSQQAQAAGRVKRRGNYEDHSRVAHFLSENKISGLQWITLPGNCYTFVSLEESRISTCHLEVLSENQHVSRAERPINDSAPLRILSFDIENLPMAISPPWMRWRGTTSKAPAKGDVIQIGNVVTTLNSLDKDPACRVIFTLGTCSPIEGVHVRSFGDRKAMLEAWLEFVQEIDPDIILGYNSTSADIHRLIQDAEFSDIPFVVGRLKQVTTKMDNPVKLIPGRVHFDLYNHYFRTYWRSLKDRVGDGTLGLGNVSQHFLDEDKEDFEGSLYNVIATYQRTSADTRRTLALYCLKDAYLALKLLHKVRAFEHWSTAWRDIHEPFHLMVSKKNIIVQKSVQDFAQVRYTPK